MDLEFTFVESKHAKQRKYTDYSAFPNEKTCSRCKLTLPATDFSIYRNTGKLVLQSYCRNCKSADDKKRCAEADAYRKAKIQEVMNGSGCPKCGEVTPYMDFAHYDRSNKCTSATGRKVGWATMNSVAALKKEEKHGRLLCMKCHFLETEEEKAKITDETKKAKTKKSTFENFRKSRQRAQEYVDKRKMEIGECAECGMKVEAKFIKFFHFDHKSGKREPGDEYVGNLIGDGATDERIEQELAKCNLLDAVCHRERTNTRLKDRSVPVKVKDFL